jgi:hypothetical protein
MRREGTRTLDRGGSRWGRGVARLTTTVVVSLTFLFAPSCENGYPLAITLCDEWCLASQRKHCETEDPAACIIDCERLPLDPCVVRAHAWAVCLNALPETQFACREGRTERKPGDCLVESNDLGACFSRPASGWVELCAEWGRRSAFLCPFPDGRTRPTDRERNQLADNLFHACSDVFDVTHASCAAEELAMANCYQARIPSCALGPWEAEGCEGELAALRSCVAGGHPTERRSTAESGAGGGNRTPDPARMKRLL